MKARYHREHVEDSEAYVGCPEGCSVPGQWHILVERGGGKPGFLICSECGAFIKKKGSDAV